MKSGMGSVISPQALTRGFSSAYSGVINSQKKVVSAAANAAEDTARIMRRNKFFSGD